MWYVSGYGVVQSVSERTAKSGKKYSILKIARSASELGVDAVYFNGDVQLDIKELDEIAFVAEMETPTRFRLLRYNKIFPVEEQFT